MELEDTCKDLFHMVQFNDDHSNFSLGTLDSQSPGSRWLWDHFQIDNLITLSEAGRVSTFSVLKNLFGYKCGDISVTIPTSDSSQASALKGICKDAAIHNYETLKMIDERNTRRYNQDKKVK